MRICRQAPRALPPSGYRVNLNADDEEIEERTRDPASHRALPKLSQEVLAEMVGTRRSRMRILDKFRTLWLIERPSRNQQLAPGRRAARLIG
jgi:hypothetical protein